MHIKQVYSLTYYLTLPWEEALVDYLESIKRDDGTE